MKPGSHFGSYEIIRRIAAGGVGEVFAASIRGSSQLCALKLAHAHLGPDAIDIFVSEARVAARIDHPAVVQVFEVGQSKGRAFISSELVEGVDLRRLLAATEPLPLPVCTWVVLQVAQALQAAWEARDPMGRSLKVIHGDVAPQNILVAFDGTVKLTDFGLARARGNEALPHLSGGTFAYFAPERLEYAPDTRSDQFALGAVYFELLTGRPLFEADSDAAVLAQVADCLIPRPSTLRHDAPGAIDDVVLTMLSRLPSERFSTPAEVVDALSAVHHAFELKDVKSQLSAHIRRAFSPSTASPARVAEEIVTDSSPLPAQGPLSAPAQLALSQLSILAGEFTLETAESVIDMRRFPQAPWALDLLQELVDAGHLEQHLRDEVPMFHVRGR